MLCAAVFEAARARGRHPNHSFLPAIRSLPPRCSPPSHTPRAEGQNRVQNPVGKERQKEESYSWCCQTFAGPFNAFETSDASERDTECTSSASPIILHGDHGGKRKRHRRLLFDFHADRARESYPLESEEGGLEKREFSHWKRQTPKRSGSFMLDSDSAKDRGTGRRTHFGVSVIHASSKCSPGAASNSPTRNAANGRGQSAGAWALAGQRHGFNGSARVRFSGGK